MHKLLLSYRSLGNDLRCLLIANDSVLPGLRGREAQPQYSNV